MEFFAENKNLDNIFIREVLFEKFNPLFGQLLLVDFNYWNYPIPETESLTMAINHLETRIKEGTVFGELTFEGEEKDLDVHAARVSHIIESVYVDRNKIYGKVSCLDTPQGLYLKQLIKNNLELEFSIRATGSINQEENNTSIAQIITWDIKC